MHCTPYSLQNDNESAGRYYHEAGLFAGEVLVYLRRVAGDLPDRFQSHLGLTAPERLETSAAYLLDLLSLGVYWRVYGQEAESMRPGARRLLTVLAGLCRKTTALRPPLNVLYGWLRGLAIGASPSDRQLDLPALDKLIHWLATSNEFYYEHKRLLHWAEFLKNQHPEKTAGDLACIMAIADWFEESARDVLGPYTGNVEPYRRDVAAKRRYREDHLACNRAEAEYHLNMVGAEILNRAFRENFEQTDHRTVLLPACMCLRQENCRAVQFGPGYRCMGCSTDCRVREVTELGRKYNFDVCVVPHTSSLFRLKSAGVLQGRGVVGVACVTNLLNGGWMLESAGIAAQCVLLNFCGCKHWLDKPTATRIDMDRLEDIIRVPNKDKIAG